MLSLMGLILFPLCCKSDRDGVRLVFGAPFCSFQSFLGTTTYVVHVATQGA